jgi:hypothetical protein
VASKKDWALALLNGYRFFVGDDIHKENVLSCTCNLA